MIVKLELEESKQKLPAPPVKTPHAEDDKATDKSSAKPLRGLGADTPTAVGNPQSNL